MRKMGQRKLISMPQRKAERNPIPKKNSFAQLSKKLERLTKALKKQAAKLKKPHREDSNSDLE
jgi:hypothetical protein